MDQTNQMLNRVPTKVILWAWLLTRILMCTIVYLFFSMSSQEASYAELLKFQFFMWFGWTIAATLFAIIGETLQPKLLHSVIGGDALLILIAITLLRGAEGAVIAFAICVSIVAVNVQLNSKWLISAYGMALLAFLLRDNVLQPFASGAAVPVPSSYASEILQIAVLGAMIVMLIIWGNRRSRLETFDNIFSSPRNLSFEKSFEFDLQIWTDALASLFGTNKAACVICAPARNAPHQYYDTSLPVWQKSQDRDELVSALRTLPIECILFDTEHNRVIFPDTKIIRLLNENEQPIARILHRANVKAAFVQPMQIDRARGGIICALPSPIDIITLSEAQFVGRHVTNMSAYLGKIARAQRNFIADAHDVARRDLHDGVLQTLAALRMRLLLLTKRADVTATPVELEIRKAVDIVTLEQSRLRGFLENSETGDHTVNLVSQIDICVRTISLQWGIEVKLKSDEPAVPVDKESSLNIEHLLREVITNAVRHAESKSLTVSLSLKQDALMMAVTDLSQPLEGAQVYEKSALILKSASLRDRLRLVNGEAYAEGLGKGTLLSIRIPMQQIEND